MFIAMAYLRPKVVFSRFRMGVRALRLLLIAAVGCAVYPHPALSKLVPIWAIFSQENSDLPNNNVRALALGPDGSLWAGTDGGLARLDKDGRWQTYSKASTSGALPDDNVRALALSPDGSLWAGTLGGGLARRDKEGQWQTYSKASTNGGLPGDFVTALVAAPDGSLWAGTLGGLARLDKEGRWQTYSRASTDGGLPDDSVIALAPGQDGSLWVGTGRPGFVVGLAGALGGGLARLDKDGRWQTYNKASTNGGLPDDAVRALAFGPDGSLWAGTGSAGGLSGTGFVEPGGGLARLANGGQWQTYSKASTNGGLPNDNIRALAPTADGSLWVGTEGGLARLDKDGRWQTFSKATNGGLPDDTVMELAVGPDGSLWAGTSGGVARLDKDGQWQTFSKASTSGGLAKDSIRALALDPDGSLWVGSGSVGPGGGLARLTKDGQWQAYSKASTDGGLPDDFVWALALGPDSSLWVGTFDGLARLPRDGRWQTYNKASTNGGLPQDMVTALALDSDGSLWVGTMGGLARLAKDGRWQTYSKASTNGGLPDDFVMALALGPDGSLWVGTQGGLARLAKDGQWQTYSNASTNIGLRSDIWALTLGSDGSLWVGTNAGPARLAKDGGWQTHSKASTNDGLPNDFVRALALDSDGSLWVGTLGGVARLAKDGQWQTYSRASTNGGLPNDFVTALALGPDGSLWAGTDGGLGYLGRPVGRNLRVVEVIGKTGEVTQAEQTVAVVAFDGSYLTQPEMFHYLWRLNEINLFGTTPGPETKTRSSVYRAVFPHDGAYQLRVAAVDRYGNRSEPKDINFNVTLPKPKTLWETLVAAWPIVVAAVTGFLALGYIVLLWLAHRSARAFAILSDAAWARWLTWPFFFMRHVPAVQRWVLEPWFQAVRRSTITDIPFLDPPVSMAAGSPTGGEALLPRLLDAPRLWLHGRSGMGKSSVFAAWERAYFVAADVPNLGAAVHKYGFILIALPLRHYAALPVPDANRPESWILEIVRRQLERHGFTTRDLGLVDAMLRAGHIAVALDGTNEVDRDLALAAFASQFPQARLLITSQAIPRGLAGGERWEVWQLPENIGGLRDGLLALWLGAEKGAVLSRRISAEGLSQTVISGYDLRLLADLAAADPEGAPLPVNRVELYRAMLARARAPDGEPLRLEGLKQLAWTMVTQRRRRIVADDGKVLGIGTLEELEREHLRIVRSIGAEREFRHDQIRAFLAALWLVDETPNLPALQKTATDAGAFGLNQRDQEELWGFVAPLLRSTANLEALWLFANNDPVERGILEHALQSEADKRRVTLVRVAKEPELETAGA
jgi:ligand-binding sensor domain-containing protein